MKHYLMVDLGTGSTRVAIVSSRREIIGIRSFSNNYYRDNGYADAQYFLPQEWEAEIFRCCRELHEQFPQIRIQAISAAGARQSIVLIDKEGKSFYGLPNIDNRGRDYMGQISSREEIYRRSGRWVTEDFCAAKLMGLRMLRPEIYRQIGQVLSLSEWIAYLFTGRFVAEPSQACETQLYDLDSGDWSEMLCRAYGVDMALLPPLLSTGSRVGAVLDSLIAAYGMAGDAVFVAGGADTQLALKQTGIKPGEIAVVSGTTSPVVALSADHCYDAQQRVWVNANSGSPDFVVEMNPGVTGLNYQRIKNNLCPELSYAWLEEQYEAKTDFACTASFSSLLFYEQRPLRMGGFFSRSPMDVRLDRVDMAWAVLADIACSTYEQLYCLMELTGIRPGFVWGCCGGFQSGTLCRMLADLSGLELRIKSGFEQATVLGLVIACNECLGEDSAEAAKPMLRTYVPRPDQLIHRYYPVWLENRSRANSL